MVITVQITPDGKSNRDVIGSSPRTDRGTYIQRCVAERAGALAASPPARRQLEAQTVQTDHDHAWHLRLRG